MRNPSSTWNKVQHSLYYRVSNNVWATLARIKEANKLMRRSVYVLNTPENKEVLVRLQEKGTLFYKRINFMATQNFVLRLFQKMLQENAFEN